MAKTIRKYLIAGNWKMNKTASEGVDLIKEINLAIGEANRRRCRCLPAFYGS
jgi:triosephosphate isomerase